MIRPGISVLLHDRRDLVAGKRIGVLTNQTGVLPDLTSSIEALRAIADVRAIFAPEHGVRGIAAEGAQVGNSVDRQHVPVYSLYGAHLAPPPDQLAGLDAIVCDLQDIGCRFYTYSWTMIKLIEVAAQAGVAVIVVDRPNPIGGAIEGPGVEEAYRSLIGLHDVPIRHGLTIGEIARLVKHERACTIDLTVVPCHGWRRTMRWNDTGLPWVAPSPSMPSPETALVYPGTCLLEGVNVSVGRGTTKPFEWIGAPWIDGDTLAVILNELELPGVRWRSIAFEPCLAPFAGEVCEGVQPHVIDADAFRPVWSGVALVWALRQVAPEQFAISTAGGIYADRASMERRMYPAEANWNVAHFDRLAGSSTLRAAINSGVAPDALVREWTLNEDAFRTRIAPVLLYD